VYRVFRSLEKFINRNADFIITSSGAGAKELVENWGIRPDRVRSLIDGVDCQEFRPHPKEEARRALQLPMDRPIAVFLGVLNRYQGVDILLEVIRIVRQKGLMLHFLVMGFPEEKYRRMAEEAGITNLITFTGRIDYSKAAFYLSAGDIALSPKISLTEANGKLFNYMACSLPTVVFDTPINREILGEEGVYAAYADAMDFANKIETLIKDEKQRLDLAGMGRAKAEREHSWEARGKELEGIYHQLTSGVTNS
jgi:glycosyltransferase involved in cell wall biosynthesis